MSSQTASLPPAARKRNRTPLQKALVAPAGEYYVLYELHRRGMLATHAMRRLRAKSPYAIEGYPDGWLDVYRERWDLLGRGAVVK